jgi:hypothetical protein
MVVDESSNATMRTVRIHKYGEPVEVLRLNRIAVQVVGPSSKRLSEAPNSKLELPQQQMQILSVDLRTSDDFILHPIS